MEMEAPFDGLLTVTNIYEPALFSLTKQVVFWGGIKVANFSHVVLNPLVLICVCLPIWILRFIGGHDHKRQKGLAPGNDKCLNFTM